LASTFDFCCLQVMFSDSFSQAEGFSQGPSMGFGSPLTTPQKAKGKVEDRQSCLPVMANTVAAAVAQLKGGEELQIHGQEVSMVLLVGVVENLVEQAASLEFVLNDSTARLRIRQYFTGEKETGKVALGQYVTVVGAVRSTPELHVSAQFVHPVASPDEVSYHIVESTHAALKLRRATGRPVATPQAVSPVKTSVPAVAALVATPTKAAVSHPEVVPAAAPMAVDGDALSASVLAVLARAAENPTGVALAAVVQELAPASEAAVKSCLVALVEAGEIFNTIDDNHFGAL